MPAGKFYFYDNHINFRLQRQYNKLLLTLPAPVPVPDEDQENQVKFLFSHFFVLPQKVL